MARPTLRAPKTTATGGSWAIGLRYPTGARADPALATAPRSPPGPTTWPPALLGPHRYAHTRGVAQQAARLARATRLGRGAAGPAPGRGVAARPGPRPGRPASRPWSRPAPCAAPGTSPWPGWWPTRAGADFEAALRGLPPVTWEVPEPGAARRRPAGAAGHRRPHHLGRRRARDARRPACASWRRGGRPGDPAVRVLVARVARLADDPARRALVEHLAPRAPASG